MLRKILPKSEFARNAFTLITGTSVAQAIPFAVAPILTRLYTPEEFGTFGLYLALFSTLATIQTLRYSMAIILPRKDVDAASLVILSVLITVFFNCIFCFLTVVFNDQISKLLGNENIGDLLYLLPFSLFFYGIFEVLSYWSIRTKKYAKLATCRVVRSGGVSLIQISFGLLKSNPLGLTIGHLVGQIVSAVLIVPLILKNDIGLFKNLTKLKILANKNKYIDYPKYSVLPSMLDSFTLMAPIFFITKGYDLVTVGYMSLTMRVMAAPATIVSSAIGQVYLQRISKLANKNPKLLNSEVIKTGKKLAILSSGIFLPFFLFGEEVFSFIFGGKWSVAGHYAEYLCVSLAIRFFISPLSTIFGVTNNVKLGANWKYLYFFSTIIVLYTMMQYEFELFLQVFIANEVIMYFLYLILILYASKNYKKRIKV